MRTTYPNVKHQFGTWHVSKGTLAGSHHLVAFIHYTQKGHWYTLTDKIRNRNRELKTSEDQDTDCCTCYYEMYAKEIQCSEANTAQALSFFILATSIGTKEVATHTAE